MVDCSVQLYGHWLEPGLLFPIKPLKSFTPNNLSAPCKRFSLGRQLQRASLPGPSEHSCGNSIKLLHGDTSTLLAPVVRISPSRDKRTQRHLLPLQPPRACEGLPRVPAVAVHPGGAAPEALSEAGVYFIEVSSLGEQHWAPKDTV